MTLVVELLHTRDCHAYHQALDALEEALVESGLPVRLEVRLVRSAVEASGERFLGSPTIRINGEDIDPRARSVTKFGILACRPYPWHGRMLDSPPKEMILGALKKHQ